MTALLLALALARHPTPPCEGHVAPRSGEAKKEFRQAHPCPSGPDKGSTRHCEGYIIDHICLLVCCGLDAPQNMQWQTDKAAKEKDKWERDCSTCRPGSPTGRDGRKPYNEARPLVGRRDHF